MNLSSIKQLIANDIDKFNEVLINCFESDVVVVNQISDYIISSGGKRLRPILLILITNAFNYKDDNKYLMAAVVELIHTATLLHDDVVDKSDIRRGHKTVNKIWDNATAVLVGDFLYSRAFEMMLEPNLMQIMQIMSKATNKIAEGEIMQLHNCGNINLTEDKYLKIIESKTACLFEATSQIAGVLVASNNLEQLSAFGINLGNAFQIVDDILDYKSKVGVMGKNIGDDLTEGKITLPLIYALQKITDTSDQEQLLLAIKNNNIDDIIVILDKIKAFDYAMQKAQIFANIAKDSIAFLPNNDSKKALIALCDLSFKRNL